MVQVSAAERPAGAETTKWVYLFREGSADMRDLLGGKGAGVAGMTRAGLPVPPGFTITTQACNAYFANRNQFPPGMWDQVLAALRTLEQESGKRFGDPSNPLLVSVRSGAKFSMPGMMDTVLNLGLNDETVEGLARLTNNPRFAYDAYRRFVQMFGRIVLDIPAEKFDEVFEGYKRRLGAKADTDLDAEALKQITQEFKEIVRRETGKPFPSDPLEQLRLAIAAVFDSWMGKRAVDYRNFNKIPHDLGTAVNVQMMVFGNMGDDSGTGVAFSRNPETGENALYGEFLPNAQGEDVVAGIRTPLPISKMQQVWPDVYQQFRDIAHRLEQTYRDVQDMEFTVERGKLYMLQTRTGKRTAKAAVKIAVDMVQEGLISKEEAVLRVEPSHVEQLLLPRFEQKDKQAAVQAGRLLTTGIPASPGAAVGAAIFDADRAEERALKGERVILVRPETSPEDVHGMIPAEGVLTARGGKTSHAAVVARGMGKPAVVGAEALAIDLAKRTMSVGNTTIAEGDVISIDGSTGEVIAGELPKIEPRFSEERELAQILAWADEIRRLGCWANADYPRDARKARELGAEGIGLCRTEHMFMEEERLPYVQQMILSAPEAAKLLRPIRQLREQLVGDLADDTRADLERKLRQAQAAADASPAVKRYLEALDRLLEFQRSDFVGILEAMEGLPVIIRLIDPPLHEFLPSHEELLKRVVAAQATGQPAAAYAEDAALLAAVESMREQNPMLGLRGIRLGILYPEIIQMQTRAILEAATELAERGVETRPEIMIPLVGDVAELRAVRRELEPVAREVTAKASKAVHYKFGTMIEIPRAALTAGQIASEAEFFSFGTNDLTQTTYGFSRDDAEAKFLAYYMDQKLLPVSPFQVLDRAGVGKLMMMAVQDGRATRQDLEVGICGEHGGDPSSIEFCHQIGLDYVSASPYRVPVARLAAAQAAIRHAGSEKDR